MKERISDRAYNETINETNHFIRLQLGIMIMIENIMNCTHSHNRRPYCFSGFLVFFETINHLITGSFGGDMQTVST